MRSERICSLARKLQNLPMDAMATYSHQWFERTLGKSRVNFRDFPKLTRSSDDSAIRRISIPESYLCADALMLLLDNVSKVAARMDRCNIC